MKPSNSRAVEDLGPLAWVLDEVKKSVSSATKSLRRYVRDAEAARGSDLASVDANALRVARQQIHQACGALEMVGQAGPNLLLKAMEEVVQHAVQKPELCTDSTVDLIERCGFALTEYLERAANGKSVEPVELFSHYRDARSKVGAHRIHPADLWAHPWRWADPAVSAMPASVADGSTGAAFCSYRRRPCEP
jgi:chemosensory pili system protein ChpA (sensor histidine kinase/response regulator)